jgi:hypothetical protein
MVAAYRDKKVVGVFTVLAFSCAASIMQWLNTLVKDRAGAHYLDLNGLLKRGWRKPQPI